MRYLSTLGIALSLIPQLAAAQIIPDQTLPNNSSILSPDGQIIFINGGTQAGGNLFHSFQEFNINSGQFVLFNNGLDVTNIFSRVTGNNISLINGTLSANGTANLFLINPNGITFGQNAQLLLGGSFIGTTASQINFADGGKLDILNPNQSLLTVSAPIGLQFTPQRNGIIRVQGQGHQLVEQRLLPSDYRTVPNFLGVFPTQSLALLGGDIQLEGGVILGINSSQFLSAVKAGDVSWQNDQFSTQGVTAFGDITLSQQSLIASFGTENNQIDLIGRNIVLGDGSFLATQNVGIFSDRSISIQATDSIRAFGQSEGGLRSGILSESINSGKGADILVNAPMIELTERGRFASVAYTDGEAGNLRINGDILQIRAGSLASVALLSGQVGAIDVSVSDTVTVSDSGVINLTFLNETQGADLRIQSTNLNVLNGGIIATQNASNSQGGGIFLNIKDTTTIAGINPDSDITFNGQPPFYDENISQITTILSFPGTGVGGNLDLTTNRLIMDEGGILGTIQGGFGQSGDVNIEAQHIEVKGQTPLGLPTLIFSNNLGKGDAGTVNILTRTLNISEGASISSATLDDGNAGNLQIQADTINIDQQFRPSQYFAIEASTIIAPTSLREAFNLPENPRGFSGNINIQANTLNLTNGAAISVSNESIGDAGNLSISASNLSLTNHSQITAATASGQGGNIFLNGDAEGTGAPARLFLNNAQITATAGGTGDGGNITLNNNTTFILNNSQITANAFEGNGGNIEINTEVLFIDPSSEITASSALGIDGVVDLNAEFDLLDNNLSILSLNPPKPPLEIRVGCEEIELIRRDQLSVVNQGFVGVVKENLPNLPANGLVYRDGKWVTGRYVTQQELDDWGCFNSNQSSVNSHQQFTSSSYQPSQILLAQAAPQPLIESSFTLEAIAFEGNTLFSEQTLRELVENYTGKSYSIEDYTTIIQEIQEKINYFYRQQGYIFSGAYLKGDQAFDGTLIFTVVEQGRISEISIEGLERLPDSYVKNRIFALVKSPFNVNDLNFALTQLQNDPRIEAISGDLITQTTLRLTVVEAEAFQVGIEGNNYNSFLVGENQLQLTASSLNLFGFGDTGTFQWQHTEGSDQFYIGYGVPLNGKGGELRMNYQQGNTILLVSPLDQFDIEQFQQTVGIQYYQPVIKKPHNELAFFMGLDWRQNNSSLLGEDFSFVPEIQDASTRYTALSVGQNWINRKGNQAFLLRNELRFGVDFLDATVLDTPSGIDGRYFLWRFQAQYANRLASNWLFRANFSGQLTPDALLFGERIQIGGIYTVPGFAYNQFSGDNGYYGQVALEYTVFNQDDWGTFTLFPYLSYGFVDNNKFVSPSPDTIASAALGLRYQRDWFYARFDYAQPLTANVRNQNILAQFGVNFTF